MKILPIIDAIKLAKKYGIRFAKYEFARNEKELKKACGKTGFPLAMKISSQKISHKSDEGGVGLHIEDFSEAKGLFRKMKKLRGFDGVLLQRMQRGIEVIVGGKRDLQFGPTVVFGLGGIRVEVLRDFSIGICPLTKGNAKEMVERIRGYPILAGIRGQRGASIPKITESIRKIARLMQKEKNVLEIDINPLIATPHQIIAVDARVVVE